MTTQEIIKELEQIKRLDPCFRGASYDYKKGYNDAQWDFYKLINNLISKLNGQDTKISQLRHQ